VEKLLQKSIFFLVQTHFLLKINSALLFPLPKAHSMQGLQRPSPFSIYLETFFQVDLKKKNYGKSSI
jgi:hypothetical protein